MRKKLTAYERFCIAMFFQVIVIVSACITALAIIMSPTSITSAYMKLTMLGAFWGGLVVLNIKVKQSIIRLKKQA